MNNLMIGLRLKQFRKHFKLTQEALSQEIGMTRGNISKIEKNKIPPSNAFLKALRERFACNPDWIKTGEGEMFVTPEEYIGIGIRFLGERKYGEGLAKIFKDSQFKKLRETLAIEDVQQSLSDELRAFLQLVSKVWEQGDEKDRRTLVQLVKAVSHNEENA
jgi:transcriptional regulator with XRE-family HTH domain